MRDLLDRSNLARLRQLIDEAGQDGRYGMRSLWRSRGFAGVIVLTLGIGLGAAVGVFAVVNATLINELPYPEPDRLVVLSTETSQYFSRPGFRRLRNMPGGLELPSAAEARQFQLTSSGRPEFVWGHSISDELITLLGLTSTNRPHLGRLFDVDPAKNENEVLLTYRAWVNRYDRNPGVVGTTVALNGLTRQIVGVLGPRVDLFQGSEFVLALNPDGPNAYNERYRSLEVFGRLPSGDDAEDMEARLGVFFRSLQPTQRGHVEYVRERMVHGFRSSLLAMWLAALLVLLVCCLNFAGLLSTRFWSRRAEFALRVRLGATRERLIRQLLTEGLLLATAGGVLGVLLAWLAREMLVKSLTNDAVTSAAVTFDWNVTAAVSLGCVAIGILFTLSTARQVSSSSMSPAGGRPVMPRRRRIAAVQVAAAMVLIGASAALIQSLARLQAFEVGYDVDNAVTVRFDLPLDTYRLHTTVAEFVSRTLPVISAIPGIERVSATSALPHSTTPRQFSHFVLEREPPYVLEQPEQMPLGWPPLPPPPPPPPGEPPGPSVVFHRALSFVTAPGFFQTMGVPVLQGRDFRESDNAPSERVVIVNEAFARRYFANENPLLKRLRLNPRTDWLTVVGVVGNIRRFDDQTRSEFYRPYGQIGQGRTASYAFFVPVNSVAFVLKTPLPPSEIRAAIRTAVFAIDRNLPIAELSTLRAAFDGRLEERRGLRRLFVALASLTLFLAAIGVYGVTNYFVRQRMPELSVRAALGATRRQLIWLPMRDSVVVLSMGLPIGLLLSIGAAGQLQRMVASVEPYDWSVLMMAAAVLSGCVLMASYVSARRGASADPMVYMNSD